MALDDGAFDNEIAASFLKALRENTGIRSQRDELLGNSYSTGHYFGTITQDTTVNVYIENPADSGVVIFPHAMFSSTGQMLYHKVDSVTVDTAGTSIGAQNRLIDDGSTSANIEYNVSYSGGNPWTQKIGGDLERKMATMVSDFDIVLTEGDNVVYEITNDTSSDIKAGIDVDYVEVSKNDINKFVE